MRLSHLWLYRAQIAASLLSFALFVLTLVDPQWIEAWFDASPDDGDGSAERLILGGFFLVTTLLTAALALRQRRHLGVAAADR